MTNVKWFLYEGNAIQPSQTEVYATKSAFRGLLSRIELTLSATICAKLKIGANYANRISE